MKVESYIDAGKIENAVKKHGKEAFKSAGKLLKKCARKRIKTVGTQKKNSPNYHARAGESPHSHGKGKYAWKNAFAYGYDSESVAIGPRELNGSTYKELSKTHEFGGDETHTYQFWGLVGGDPRERKTWKKTGKSTKKQRLAWSRYIKLKYDQASRKKTAHYEARPTMSPAMDENRENVVKMWEKII